MIFSDPHDNPQLTAYALGELDGDEARAIEALLAHDPAARRFVDETREAAGLISSALTPAAAAARLNGEQVQAIERMHERTSRRQVLYRFALPGAGAAAAVLAIAAVVWMQSSPVIESRELAVASPQPAQAGAVVTNETGVINGNALVTRGLDGRELRNDVSGSLDLKSEVRGEISAGSTLTKAGSGTLTLAGSKGYTGRTTISAGTVALLSEAATSRHGDEVIIESGTLKKQQGLSLGGAAYSGTTVVSRGRSLDGSVEPQVLTISGTSSAAGAGSVVNIGASGLGFANTNLVTFGYLANETFAAYDPQPAPHLLMTTAGEQPAAGEQLGIPGYVIQVPSEQTPKLTPVEMPGSTATYAHRNDNPFKRVAEDALSTFSIDVDTASYSNIRRFLAAGQLPPADAVRLEEMINYFPYYYDQPVDGKPFAVHTEVADCPWASGHKLVKIGLKGREVAVDKRPASNLVFLIDVSGSMSPAERLPLLVDSLKLMVEQLNKNDKVSIVVYAGAAGMVLAPTRGDQKQVIIEALDRLHAGGSTAGAAGIQLAYQTAVNHFIKGGVNRVILCTDGDFNVGVSDPAELVKMIEAYRKTGVFLSVLGFGTDNLKDHTMEQLADKGNGHYAYIDSLREGRKVLVDQLSGTLVTIAKDVKIQVEFNPASVASYRLLGYEKRVLAHQDFNDDTKDAGEIGAGHTVTALYEIVPASTARDESTTRNGGAGAAGDVDELKYQKVTPTVTRQLTDAAQRGELMTVKLRYKQPDGDVSTKIEHVVKDAEVRFDAASADMRFAASVASYGMLLRGSPYRGEATLDTVVQAAEKALGDDQHGYRAEFIEMVRKTKGLGR